MAGTGLPGPGGVAQLGYLRRLFRDPQPVLDELRDRYGPVCGFGFGPMRMALVGDPTALRDLFAAPTDRFRWGHWFNVLGFVTGPQSIVVSDGPDHARRFTVQVVVAGKPFGTGEGRSKQMAEKEAAQRALEEIERQQESA